MELEWRHNSIAKAKQKINDLVFESKEKPMHSIFNSQ